jgi:ubiquinol-cytochrome c reductase cytochrome c1 subunit
MKKLIFAILVTALPGFAVAAGGGIKLDSAPIDTGDRESQARGAQTYVQYCLGCHSLKFQRYNRLGADLGLDDEALKALMVGTEKTGDTMLNAMPAKQAQKWFGTKIPDLSLVSRSRGTDWLYTYLRSFYADPSRPLGVNNLLFKDVGMPHVLWELQGLKQAVYKTNEHGQKVIERLEPGIAGTLSEAQYDQQVADLVNFLDYVGEPIKQKRERLGFWVLAFLVVFFGLSYALKKEYWRDIH